MRRISDVLVDMESKTKGEWIGDPGVAYALVLHIAEIREVVDFFAGARGDGWAPFGTHIDCDVRLDFFGTDEAGMPLWERPIIITHGDSDEDF